MSFLGEIPEYLAFEVLEASLHDFMKELLRAALLQLCRCAFSSVSHRTVGSPSCHHLRGHSASVAKWDILTNASWTCVQIKFGISIRCKVALPINQCVHCLNNHKVIFSMSDVDLYAFIILKILHFPKYF